jgi:hypothetical protein
MSGRMEREWVQAMLVPTLQDGSCSCSAHLIFL